MTLLALPGRASAGLRLSAASNWGKVNPLPSNVRAPAVSVSRRVRPSQHRRGLPSRRIMRAPPGWEGRGGAGGNAKTVAHRADRIKRQSPSVATDGLRFAIPHLLLRQREAGDLLVVADEDTLLRERRVAPDVLPVERRGGLVDQLGLVDLLIP